MLTEPVYCSSDFPVSVPNLAGAMCDINWIKVNAVSGI